MHASNTTEDPFLLAIAAFACLFDAQLAHETKAARGGEADASAAVTPPPLPPMVLHAASPKQGFDPDLPPSRWLPGVARAVRQRRPWGADELLKALRSTAGDSAPFPRMQVLMPLLSDWCIVDLIAAWLADEPGQATRGTTWVSTRPSALLQCLVEYHAWHQKLEQPLRVHERDTIAATLIQLLRMHTSPGTISELISRTLKEMLTEPSPPSPYPVDGGAEVSVQPLKVVAVTELGLLQALADVVNGNDTWNILAILSQMCDVSLQLRPIDVDALHDILFHPTRATSAFSSMQLRFMGHFPMHHATTPENIRSGLRGLGGLAGVTAVRAVLSLVEWAVDHPETHHRATLFDPADDALLLRRVIDGAVAFLNAASAADVTLTMLRAHSAGLIDLREQRQWIMLLADIASRFLLLSNNGGGGTHAVVAALAGVPAVDAAVRQRYRG